MWPNITWTTNRLSTVSFKTDDTAVCPEKKRTKCFFVTSSIKLRRFWWNLVHNFRNKFTAKICKHFPPQLSWIMPLHYLVKLEMFITQVLPVHCQKKKLQKLSHLNCDLQIRKIWTQLVTVCGNIAREGVQNRHHWSGWNETATENGEGQAGSCRHCSSHLSVLLIADACFVHRSCNIYHMMLTVEVG